MKKDTLRLVFVFSIVVALGVALLHVSQEVQDVKNQISFARHIAEKEKIKTNMLAAEFSYLTRPERLQTLMDAYDEARQKKEAPSKNER